MHTCRKIINYQQKTSYHTHISLRNDFYNYFKSKNHKIIPSSSVIPSENDSTLLFTNAGMNQFKNTILHSSDEKRIANIQKCVRAGGKHNDLEDVGKDLHHQTFFEMMGNWSFNDAFSKHEACEFAWKYLCDNLKIDCDRLYVSYFGGSSKFGLPEDNECREIWKSIGVPENRILPFVADNFWEMGETGPCGMCTEIHFDRIGKRNASKLVNIDDSVVEIWNIVFMSHLREISGNVKSLGKNHIDTGMGFERLLSILQNKTSNFDTDLFAPIIQNISKLSNKKLEYTRSIDQTTISGRQDTSIRLLSDHIRTVSIAISDGALPDSTGRGFIIRKMLRRMFLANNGLSIDRYALPELVPTFVNTLETVYPELKTNKTRIQQIIKEEEEQFWKVVDKAKRVFNTISKKTKSDCITGKDAFNLFETYGLPLSITVELARNCGKIVDEQEFEKCQLEAQKMSKKASKSTLPVSVYEYSTHRDDIKYSYDYKNEDYEFPKISTKILDIFVENQKLEKLQGRGALILENCQFYAEQGGQATDFGFLMVGENAVFKIENAKKSVDGTVTIVYGETINGHVIKKNEEIDQKVDKKRRIALMRAHSATHLLNFALKKESVGQGQRGSAVECDRIRFDYATIDTKGNENRLDKIKTIEEFVKILISKGGETKIEVMTMEEAQKIPNLQIDDKKDKMDAKSIRVIQLGESIECCSGTHVHNLKNIGDFAIISDKSSAKGVRRIIGVTGEKAAECRRYTKEIKEKLINMEDVKDVDWHRIPLIEQEDIKKLGKKVRKSRIENK